MPEKQDKYTALKASDCISCLAIEERLALARKAGEQLCPQPYNQKKYQAAKRVAEILASDLCQQVRETLAFELRKYKKLPKSIAVKIACDVDEIAVPFLRVTPALSDTLMAELIPLLSDNAHLAVAVRSDLGTKTCHQLICHANDNATLKVINNSSVAMDDSLASLILDHFSGTTHVLEAVAKRPNLPLSVVSSILRQVGDHLRQELITTYRVDDETATTVTINSVHEATWRQIRHATPGQVHAHVIDLRQNAKLTLELMLAMAERGCNAFMESALALMSSLTVTDVREVLHLANPKQFHALMCACEFDRSIVEAIHKLARRRYGSGRNRREVGNPALWQDHPTIRRCPQTAA